MTGRQDLQVRLPARPGALADLGEALGRAGVSLEGGGVSTLDGTALAHYLVDDGPGALAALAEAGIGPARVHDIVATRLDQARPGGLGALARWLAEAGVDVQAQYSDHDGTTVLVVAEQQIELCRRTVAQAPEGPTEPA